MGERAAAAAGGMKNGASKSGAKMGGGIGAMLHDKARMSQVADSLGALGGQQEVPPPPAMAPMDMGGGAAAANGDPAALVAALAQRRQMMAPQPSIMDRLQRMRGGY